MSNPDATTHTSQLPELEYLSDIPEDGSPPDGAARAAAPAAPEFDDPHLNEKHN